MGGDLLRREAARYRMANAEGRRQEALAKVLEASKRDS